MFSSNNKDLKINKDEKFFSKLLSKESSLANQSFRAATGSVPFTWESQPGKSKHTNPTTPLLPLTPPPSYYTNAESKVTKKVSSKSSLFRTILHGFSLERKSSMPSSPSTSSSSVSSASSSVSRFISTSSPLFERFSSSRMSFMSFGEDRDLDDQRSKKVSDGGGGGGVQCCNKIVLVKRTLLMIIGRRSS